MKKLLLFKNQGFKAMLLLGLLLLVVNNANAQTVTPYTTSTTWLCPAGVFSVQVECWGAGGGGGAATAADTSTSNRSGGGGGAGSYVKKTIAVVPGTTYTVTVGAGGIKGDTSIATGYFGGPGGKSEFSGPSITAITASGGTGGTGAGTSNLTSNPGGVLGGLYGFTVSGTKINSYTTSSVVSLTGGGGSGVTTIFRTASSAISYIAATNQGTGYTTAPSVAVSIGSGQTFTALVNPNINSSGAETTILGSDGGASTASAGGAGGASPDGLGGFLAGGAGGTGTTVGAEYLGATPTNAGAGGGGGFSVYALSSNIPAPKSSKGGVGANGKVVLTYTATIPSISVIPATLSLFSTVPEAPSTAQTFSVSGSLLEADIVITAPTNYEINNPSVDGTYGSTITLTQASGSVAATTINVRLKTGLTGATAYLENISLTTTNGTTKTVACSGGVLAYYYYAGSGSLANVASWSTNTNGSGGSTPSDFTTVYQVFVIRNTTAVSTDAAWNVAGTGSVIQVGDPAVPGVALTIASGFDISTTAVLPVVGNGTIDLPAASSGVNSVVFQSAVTPPGMGIMDANSEVHYQATITTATSKIFGKMFIENNSTVTFDGKPIIQTSLNVATGSTILFSNSTGNYITVNETATVAIDGSLKSAKAAGIFSYGVTTPGTSFGSIQFKAAVGGLTLGSSSTVEYNRTGSSTAQLISTLPTGVKYNNLTLSDSGAANNKLFSGAVTVNNTFTLNQSLSTLIACGNLTLADGATIVRTGGSLDAAPVFGTTVNVSYNGATAITSGVEIPTATSVLNNLTVNNAAGVTLGGNATVNAALTFASGNLAIGANTLTLNGSVVNTSGSLKGSSTSNLTVGGAAGTLNFTSGSQALNNLSLGASGVASLGSALDIYGVLGFTAGSSLNMNTQAVTLKSTATATARVSDLTGSTLSNATNVTVERYIPFGKRAFRFLTPSVTTTSSIYNNWQIGGATTAGRGTHITGSTTGANGFDITASGNPSMYTYQNNVDVSTTGWLAILNTDVTTLTAGMGYRTLVRGDRNVDISVASTDNMNVATTLSATGTLKVGTVVFDGTTTPALNTTNNTFTNGYSLIGNPYASPVDWELVTKSNVEDSYYAWDPNMGTVAERGRYVAYSASTHQATNSGTGTSNVSQFIQPGQAFFVKTIGASPSLTFKEADKASTFTNVFRTIGNSSLSVSVYNPSEVAFASPIDATIAVFATDFDASVGLGDVEKLYSTGEHLAWSRGTKLLAMDATTPVVASDELLLKTMQFSANKSYTFKVNTTNFDSSLTGYLVDQYLNSQTQLDFSTSNFITFATTTDAASYGADRFKVVFNSSALNNEEWNTKLLRIYPNPVVDNQFTIAVSPSITDKVTICIYNMIGQSVYRESATAINNSIVVHPSAILKAGVYMVEMTNNGKTSTQKIIIK